MRLAAETSSTLVTLCHAGVPDDAFGLQHREGWTWVLNSLHDRFMPATPG